MDNALKLALCKFNEDVVRDTVSPGVYNVEGIVKIKGKLTVNEDYERRSTTSLPHTEILALALHLCGIQQDRAIQVIRDSVKTCLSEGESAVGCIKEQLPHIETEITRIKKEIIDSLPKQACRGNVKFEAVVVEEYSPNNTVSEAKDILKELLGE